jgi:uncharacterized membrane protein/Mg-chelatase subunit ChlD
MTSFLLDRFDRPMYLWLGLALIAFWWIARRSLAGLGPIRGKLVMAIRAVVFLILVCCLAGMNRIRKNDDLTVLFVMDQSRSIPKAQRAEAESFIKKSATGMKPNDRLSILTFDGQANIEQLPSKPGVEGGVHIPMPFADGQKPDQTDIAQALRVAAACALDSTNNRVVILSDGNQNVGDLLEEARAMEANHISVDVLPLRHEFGSEVVFEQLRAPPYANVNELVTLRLILRSDRPTMGTILIYQRVGQNEELVDLDPKSPEKGQRKALEVGRNAFVVRLPITEARAHEFRAEFVPDDKSADVIAENNIARAFTNVEGPQTLLFISSQANHDEDDLLVNALVHEGIRVQWEVAESVNLDTSVLQDYSAVVLANVGANLFSAAQQQSLATYVRDLGGGLVMIGGDDSFGAGGWQGSVVEDIMPIKFDVDAVKQIPRGALAIVMHSCEMPQGNAWGIETAVAALKAISSLDYFGVVDWGMTGYAWDVKMQVASNKEAIITQIRKMQNSDMPDFDTPMTMAYQALMNCKDAAQRHMIIISDGDPSPPSFGLINKMVGNKVTCSTVSIFPHGGMQIATLKDIAKATGGTYYDLSKPGDEKQLPRIFIKEAKIVRRPLLRDEVFKPVNRPTLSDVMQGIGKDLPELRGYVVTTPRKVVDVEMPLVTKRGDPLLAHWLCGFGRTLAFTSGGWKHWGAGWPAWEGFNKFWSQAIRWCMQQGSAANYDVQTIVEGDQGSIVIESMEDPTKEGTGFSNFKQFTGKAIAPDGTSVDVPITQTGPGRYEGKFKTNQQGTYLMNITAPGEKASRPTMIRTGVTVAYSPEFRDLSVNEPLLRQVADMTRGRLLTSEARPNEVFAHNLPPTLSRTPIWDNLLKWAVLLFLMDVAFRRVAIDPIKMMVTARAYVAGLTQRFGAGHRGEATLTDLKRVRERVRESKTARGDAAGLSTPKPDTSTEAGAGPQAGAKFEATGRLKAPAKDLAESIGGHSASTTPPATPPKPSQDKDKPGESTLERLRKARQKAKDQIDEDKKDQ